MVASRKPKPRGERRPNETLEEVFQRVITEPVGGMRDFTREEAVYVRRAHFADAIISPVATLDNATLLTGDRRVAQVFPVAVRHY